MWPSSLPTPARAVLVSLLMLAVGAWHAEEEPLVPIEDLVPQLIAGLGEPAARDSLMQAMTAMERPDLVEFVRTEAPLTAAFAGRLSEEERDAVASALQVGIVPMSVVAAAKGGR